jgi:2-oxoisovalerate dehydrogenase E2 component (dihydrolipoyl transacylase)
MYLISGESKLPPESLTIRREVEGCQKRANGRYTHTLNLTPLLPYLKTTNPTQKKTYQASDMPPSLSRNPIGEEGEKVGLLSFLVKGLLLALEVHPIMRSRVKFSGDEKWLEVGRDGVVGVAVSGMSF